MDNSSGGRKTYAHDVSAFNGQVRPAVHQKEISRNITMSTIHKFNVTRSLHTRSL